jgi:hypothetical protein
LIILSLMLPQAAAARGFHNDNPSFVIPHHLPKHSPFPDDQGYGQEATQATQETEHPGHEVFL